MANVLDKFIDFINVTASVAVDALTVGVGLWNGFVELCEGVFDAAASLTVGAIDIGTDWICGLFLFPALKSAEAPADVLEESAPALAEEADAASYAVYDDAESDVINFDALDTTDAAYTDLYLDLDLPGIDALVVDSVASEDIAVVGASLEVEDAEAFA
ncbi:MAG: hypothetical protein LBF50_06415 [Azoarcus sp.]|jgi:hypothetical protein|nr:hypothetical protein [Azoarcus sp.]